MYKFKLLKRALRPQINNFPCTSFPASSMRIRQAGEPLKRSKCLSSESSCSTCRKTGIKLKLGVTNSRLANLKSLKREALNKAKPSHALRDKLDKLKDSSRAKVGRTLQAIKCQLGHRKTRYRGLIKKLGGNGEEFNVGLTI